MNLSYGQYASYRDCPQQYYWTKVGRQPAYAYFSRYGFFGILVQRVIEDFYNDKLYLLREGCNKELEVRFFQHYKRMLVEYPVEWESAEQKVDFRDLGLEAVFKFLQMIIDHKIIGQYAVSELSLMSKITRTQTISGTLDILVKRNDRVIIADGKGTIKGRDFIDTEQLLYYALIYYLKYDALPDQLAYLIYMQNDFFCLDFKKDDLMDLQVRITEVFNRLVEKDYKATPSWDVCRFCKFKDTCPDFQSLRATEQIKKAGLEGVVMTVEDLLFKSLD